VVSYTPLQLYPRGKSPRYSLDRRLGEPQTGSGSGEGMKILDPAGTRTPILWKRSLVKRKHRWEITLDLQFR
jgi:hypothetical protein